MGIRPPSIAAQEEQLMQDPRQAFETVPFPSIREASIDLLRAAQD
jgi:hypothetical protein